jgi:hypothetical protein
MKLDLGDIVNVAGQQDEVAYAYGTRSLFEERLRHEVYEDLAGDLEVTTVPVWMAIWTVLNEAESR